MPLIANRSMSLSILKTYPLSPLLLTDGLGIQWHCLAIVSIFIFNVRLILDFLSVSLKCISIQRIQNYSQKAWRSTRQLESSAVHRRVWLTIVRDQCPWQSCSLYLYAGSLAALACKNSGGKRGPFFCSPKSPFGNCEKLRSATGALPSLAHRVLTVEMISISSIFRYSFFCCFCGGGGRTLTGGTLNICGRWVYGHEWFPSHIIHHCLTTFSVTFKGTEWITLIIHR